jgi:hypothetical protein
MAAAFRIWVPSRRRLDSLKGDSAGANGLLLSAGSLSMAAGFPAAFVNGVARLRPSPDSTTGGRLLQFAFVIIRTLCFRSAIGGEGQLGSRDWGFVQQRNSEVGSYCHVHFCYLIYLQRP